MGVHSKKTTHITVYIDDDELMKQIKIQSIKNDMSISQFVCEAVKKALEAQNGEK